jgi:hypothetical protein
MVRLSDSYIYHPFIPSGQVPKMGAVRILLFFITHVISIVFASESPKVTLDRGVFTGISAGLVHRFLGIPFAMPPSVYVVPS